MKLRERDEHLDPRAERELDAIERALAGKPVDPDLDGWAELAEMLRDERPDAHPEWSAELDRAASDRFREPVTDGRPFTLADLAARLSELLPRRMAAPAGALATLAVVAVVAASTLSTGGGSDSSEGGSAAAPAQLQTTVDDAGGDSSSAETGDAAAPPLQEDAAGTDGSRDGSRSSSGGRLSPGIDRRRVDRDVTLALAAPPKEVNDVSDRAISITRDLDGIVANSNVTTAGERASATLELVIPTRNLDTAIDRLTEIGDVKSLNESSRDITGPFISAQDRLEDATAERQKLLEALGNASTDAEAEALRKQIADARKEISRAQAAFDRVSRRAQLSDLSLTIQGDRSASSGNDQSDDGRTIGDWLDDAASVLRDVAGVLLISAAIIVPLGLLIAIAWFAASRMLRRRRERALDV